MNEVSAEDCWIQKGISKQKIYKDQQVVSSTHCSLGTQTDFATVFIKIMFVHGSNSPGFSSLNHSSQEQNHKKRHWVFLFGEWFRSAWMEFRILDWHLCCAWLLAGALSKLTLFSDSRWLCNCDNDIVGEECNVNRLISHLTFHLHRWTLEMCSESLFIEKTTLHF